MRNYQDSLGPSSYPLPHHNSVLDTCVAAVNGSVRREALDTRVVAINGSVRREAWSDIVREGWPQGRRRKSARSTEVVTIVTASLGPRALSGPKCRDGRSRKA